MPYQRNRSFASLYDPRYVSDAGHEIVDRVGDRFVGGARRRTPVARLPEAYKGDFEAWIQDRGGRVPRTLRDAWRRTGVLDVEGMGLRVIIENPDPIAKLVEFDTKPHAIRAKQRVRADGRIQQGALRFPFGPVFMYRVEVWHPGTQGVHMLRDAEAEIDVSCVEIGERVLDEFAATYDERYGVGIR